MNRALTNQDIAVIMETQTEMMAQQGTKRAPLNFWWAVGQVFGIEPQAAQDAIRHAERYGMSKQ